ncbi:MAG: cytochrome c [Burkholderiales bacterium]|nr:cytochrome c [Burkholderiales bacterium]
MKTILGLILFVLTGAALAQAPVGNAEAAKSKISMCIGCHGIPGYKTVFPHVYRVPMITGQSPLYIVNALQAYKSGARQHPSMRGIAQGLSEQDIADLAAYYSTEHK